MADTEDIQVNSSTWTSLTPLGGDGFITNGAKQSLWYREDDVQPTDEQQGHVLRPEDYVSYELSVGQQVWGRLKGESGIAYVTPK